MCFSSPQALTGPWTGCSLIWYDNVVKPTFLPDLGDALGWRSCLSFVSLLFVPSEVAVLTDSWAVVEISFIFLLLRMQSTCLWKPSLIVSPTMASATSSLSCKRNWKGTDWPLPIPKGQKAARLCSCRVWAKHSCVFLPSQEGIRKGSSSLGNCPGG